MDKSWFPTVSEIKNPEPVSWVENECVWPKMTIFRRFSAFGGGLVGDFNKGHMSQICVGCILEVF